MPTVSLPILSLTLREQRYSCHGCGNCCRDFTVQLREEDLFKLRSQDWETKLGEPVTVQFRGATFLRQREDGACMFLMEDGLCRIHAEFGFENKPIACQLFPFHLTPGSGGIVMGINFACQSVLENKGAELASHRGELMRMAGLMDEMKKRIGPPMLSDQLRSEDKEVVTLTRHTDAWLAERSIDLATRLDGLAWVALSLVQANLGTVRGGRFDELLEILFGALPEELEHHPVTPLTSRQRKMLRQAIFARTEDPKLRTIEKVGRLRTTLGQLARNRRFRLGRGIAPNIGEHWPSDVKLEAVESIGPATSDREAIEDLMTRYLRATILAGRCWGASYYGWSLVRGLGALLVNVTAVGWLARLHAAGQGRDALTIDDVRAALGRVDRTAGRARWLGSVSERLRLRYLSLDDGLRRLLKAYPLIREEIGD